jgi:hypothetical protein
MYMKGGYVMNYREALNQSSHCPKCCSKTLERFMKDQKKDAGTSDKSKSPPKK